MTDIEQIQDYVKQFIVNRKVHGCVRMGRNILRGKNGNDEVKPTVEIKQTALKDRYVGSKVRIVKE